MDIWSKKEPIWKGFEIFIGWRKQQDTKPIVIIKTLATSKPEKKRKESNLSIKEQRHTLNILKKQQSR